ncbi:hypothetical protein D3C87_1619900 [compost metagenome]
MFTALENLAVDATGQRVGAGYLDTAGNGNAGLRQSVIVENVRCRAGNMQGDIISRIQRLAGTAGSQEHQLVANDLLNAVLRLGKAHGCELGGRATGLRIKRPNLAACQASAERQPQKEGATTWQR